jgi:hypothetical protein
VIFIYELTKYVRLKDILLSNLATYKKILILFKYNKASDFRKQKLMLNYSKTLFIISIKILTIIISIFILLIIMNYLSNTLSNLVISVLGFVEISLFFLIYHSIRKKRYAKL